MYDFSREIDTQESLLWSGQPSNISVLDKEYKAPVLTKIILTSAVFVAFIALLVINGLKDPNGGIQVSIILILCIIGFLANTGSFYQVKKLQNDYTYAITNKRIIIHADECKSIEYNQIKKAAIVKDSAGQTSILLNKAAETKPKNIRMLAEKCATRDGERFISNIALYAIPNGEAVASLLEEHLPQ